MLIKERSWRLFLCAFAILFWELVLIRWLSSSIRIVSYYTNIVLISAFFGLGCGALLARFQFSLKRFIFPALALLIVGSNLLSPYLHFNINSPSEYVWIGPPSGVNPLGNPALLKILKPWLILGTTYALTSLVFVFFGQWIGHLFKNLPPLKAYTLDIMGSICGIVAFGLISYFHLTPQIWFVVGFVFLLLIMDRKIIDLSVGLICTITVLLITTPTIKEFIWSPYYKINFQKLDRIYSTDKRTWVSFDEPAGYRLTVNNDYHQMMLNLKPGLHKHRFFTEWSDFYAKPYLNDRDLPAGPILIVGSGTGNDVMAALRNTEREIDAVDIDPVIIELGRKYHEEQPYQNPRVRTIINDARSHFHNSKTKYAHVVFGFLDSHTLVSSFSSLRLDNFVYTLQSFEEVKELLLPGGQVTISFATNRPWLHEKFIHLLTETFGSPPRFYVPEQTSYPNGFVYQHRKSDRENGNLMVKKVINPSVPTDDWPFLYLEKPEIPRHYHFFLILISCLSVLPLFFLPKGQRKIRLPYFFLGAAFFLLETTNVVSLSLLYGSTWIVNASVFTGILTLILLGNLTCARLKHLNFKLIFLGLGLNLILAFATPTSALLAIEHKFLQGFAAILIFLGPIYFASLIFAALIKKEKQFYQAYGSNVLGAVIGGAIEYFSLMVGFKFLIVITGALYLTAFLTIERQRN